MEDSAAARAKAIPSLFAQDADLQRRGAGLCCSFLLQIGDVPLYADLAENRLTLTHGPLLMRSWRFALRGDAPAWLAFWEAVPAPGFHDIFALTKAQRFVLEGDLHPFMSRLLFFKDLLSLPRRLAASS